MHVFEIGDRVICLHPYCGKSETVNETGIVIARELGEDGRCGVRFDRYVDGHTLNRRCERGHGWWIPDKYLAPAEPTGVAPPDLEDLF